jgi:hypothetical protein
MQQVEESKHDTISDIHESFEVLSRQVLANTYKDELWTAYSKARDQEAALKQKAAESEKPDAEGAADGKPQKGKKKIKEVVTTLQFGSGTRKFMDYLTVLGLLDRAHFDKMIDLQ